jgi:hypothetical protein
MSTTLKKRDLSNRPGPWNTLSTINWTFLTQRLLEVNCSVGTQTEIILGKLPGPHITVMELND